MKPPATIKFAGNTTKPGNPIWDEYVDPAGRSTLEIHKPHKIWQACSKHYFVASDNAGNVHCRKCGFGQKIVWGIHVLREGKIIKLQVK